MRSSRYFLLGKLVHQHSYIPRSRIKSYHITDQQSRVANMPKYPGLGLHVRYNDEPNEHYPTGAHGGSLQDISSATLLVRELAMMAVMDQLTDKENWHKKVFDETIVAKWRSEALSIPDKYFCALATSAKYRRRNDKDEFVLEDDYIDLDKLTGIMSTTSFDYVSASSLGFSSIY